MISDIKKNKEKNILKPRAVRFPDDQWNRLSDLADKEGVNVSEIVRHIVSEFLGE